MQFGLAGPTGSRSSAAMLIFGPGTAFRSAELAKKTSGIEAGDRVLIEHHVSRVWDDGRITIEVAGSPVTIKATLP